MMDTVVLERALQANSMVAWFCKKSYGWLWVHRQKTEESARTIFQISKLFFKIEVAIEFEE